MFTTSLALSAFASLALAQSSSSPAPTVTVTDLVTVTVTEAAVWSSGTNVYPTEYPVTYTAPSASVNAASATHTVQVGAGGKLKFDPQNITANPGDSVLFIFNPKNHTVTQSSFLDPCKPLGSSGGIQGFNAGFNPVAADATVKPTFSIKINDTKPVWAYCQQTGHCQQGMVFSVNENKNATFETFQKRAQGVASSSSPTATGASGAGGAGGATGSAGATGTGAASADSSSSTSESSGAISTSTINVGLTVVLAVLGGFIFVL